MVTLTSILYRAKFGFRVREEFITILIVIHYQVHLQILKTYVNTIVKSWT